MFTEPEYQTKKTVNAAERQPVILSTISFPIASKTIDERLVELYCETKKHDTDEVEDSTTSSLLESLVKKEQLATLIVKLYPNSEGFSIILRKKSGSESETIKLPYEEVDMLSFIDAQELPVMLLDLLDEAEVNLFHNGCIIAEIRDFRYASSLLYCKTHYVLLRPTQQSILADINSVIINSHLKTRDDRLVLESQLVKLASGPLCLDPSPTVFAIQHEITCSNLRHLLHSKPVISLFASHSHGALNRKRKLEEQAAPPYLMLHDFLAKGQKSAKNGKQPGCSLNTRLIVDRWQQPEINITPPGDHVEVAKFAKLIEKPKIGLDCSLIPIEEYVFETERNQSKANFARMTFLQRTADDGLQGELYIDRDYVAGRSSGNSFKFNISSKFAADRYVDQFREIFTEEGRRQVKITHKIQGRAPSITYTQPIGLIGRTTETPASQLQQPEVVQPDAETRKSAMPLIQNQAQQQLQQQQQQQLQQQQQQQQLHQHIQQQQQLHQQQQLQSQLLLQSPNQQQHMSSLHHGGAIPQQGLLSASNFSVIPPNVNIQHMAASNAAMSNRPLMVQQSINPSGLVSPNPHVLIPPSPSPGVVHGMTVMPRMPFSNRTGQVLAPQTNMANMQSNVLTPQANLGQALLASQINMSSQINVGSAIRGPGTHVLVSPELMANRPPMMIRQMSQVISPVGEPRSYLHPQQQQMMMMMSGAETNVMDARARVANPSMQNSMMSQMTGNLAARRGRMS